MTYSGCSTRRADRPYSASNRRSANPILEVPARGAAAARRSSGHGERRRPPVAAPAGSGSPPELLHDLPADSDPRRRYSGSDQGVAACGGPIATRPPPLHRRVRYAPRLLVLGDPCSITCTSRRNRPDQHASGLRGGSLRPATSASPDGLTRLLRASSSHPDARHSSNGREQRIIAYHRTVSVLGSESPDENRTLVGGAKIDNTQGVHARRKSSRRACGFIA
jgi:hypothetical protein